jgi:zinc protease
MGYFSQPAVRRAITSTSALLAGLLATLAFASGCGAGFASTSGPRDLALDDVAFPLRELRYPSGLRVVAERDARSPVVGTFLVVGAGSSSDPKGKEGLAHYVEHLAYRSRPFGASSYPHELGRLGVNDWNARTDFDATVFHEVGPKGALRGLLRLVGARMSVPVANISDEALAVELDVVRNELRQRNETGYAGEVLGSLQAALFPANHPYARPIAGSHESLTRLTPDDVGAFIRAHYRPSNMTLVILGDIDLDTIEKLVAETVPARLLGAAQRVPDVLRMPKEAPTPPAPPGTADVLRKEAAVATPELWIAWTLPRGFDADAFRVDYITEQARYELSEAVGTDEDIAFVDVDSLVGVQATILLCRVGLYRGRHPTASRDHVLDQLYRVWRVGEGSMETRRASVLGMLFRAEDLEERGIERALSTHFVQDTSMYARAFASMQGMDGEKEGWDPETFLRRERARSVLFSPSAGRGKASASALGTTAYDDDPLEVLPSDAAALRALAAPPATAGFLDETLPSGLRVIITRRPGLPLFVARLGLSGGTSTAPDMAAAEAADVLREPGDSHQSMRPFGGRFGRASDATRQWYTVKGSSGNAGALLEVLAARSRSMRVRAESWEPFQSYFVPYWEVAETHTEVRADSAFRALLFPGHPLARSVTAESLRATSVWNTKEWLDLTHGPKNAVLVAVGDVDPAAVRGFVVDTFGGWTEDQPALPPPAPLSAAAGPEKPRRLTVTHRPGATQVEVAFGCLLPAATAPTVTRRHAVLSAALSRRLAGTLRGELGVTYGFHSTARSIPGGTAWLEAKGAVDAAKLSAAVTGLRASLVRLAGSGAAGVSDAELSWAKVDVAGSLRPGTRTADLVQLIDRTVGAGFPLGSLETAPEELAAVTLESIRADASACLASGPVLSFVGDEATIRPALEGAWPAGAP